MKPKRSLLFLKEQTNCPGSDPDQSNPYAYPTSWRYILILTSYLRLGLPSGLFPPVFPIQNLYEQQDVIKIWYRIWYFNVIFWRT